VGVIRLDDGKANAIQRDFLRDLNAALDDAEADDVRAVILCGRPGFFSAGLDLTVVPDLSPGRLRETTDAFGETMRRVFLFPKPVVAAAAGHAIAGGMMLYLAADVRVALDRPDMRFGLNEARTGIPILGGVAGLCQHEIPPVHHTELILHGRMLSAAETHARGLTHHLVQDLDTLMPCASERAAILAELDPAAYRLNKRLLREPSWDAAAAFARQIADGAPSGNVFAALRVPGTSTR